MIVIVCQDEGFVAFRDIKPAASHHYLIVPKRHLPNAKLLTQDDRPLGGMDYQTSGWPSRNLVLIDSGGDGEDWKGCP